MYTGGHLLLSALGQLFARPLTATRGIAAAVFAGLAISIFSLGLGYEALPDVALMLYGVHVPIWFLLAPLLHAYLKGTTAADSTPSDELVLRFPGYLWLMPFCIVAVLFLPTFVFAPEFKLAFLAKSPELSQGMRVYREVLGVLGGLGVLSIGYAMLRLFFELRELDARTVWHVRVLSGYVVITCVLGVIAQGFDSISLRRMAGAFACLIVLWLNLLDYRYPRFFFRLNEQIRARRESYSKSRIADLDASQTMARLDRIMREEQLYADEDLTREKLAAALQLYPAQLSELLSTVAGTDFRQYVNEQRVAAAKTLLVNEPDRSVINVAYAVGFNSKASFNRNFKALTGQTPADYRKHALDQVD